MAVHLRFRQTFPLRVSEWFLAGVMALWGMIVSTNPGMFAASPNMAQMLDVARQETWGLWGAVIGVVGLAALTVNGAMRRTPHVRAICAFIRAFFWAQIAMGLAKTGNPSTGLAVYPGMLALDIYNVFRAMADAREADDLAKLKG